MVGVTAVSDAGRDRAEAMLPGAPVLATPDLVERSELVLLAVPDDQLAGLVQGLADAGIWQPGQLVVHTSPDHGVEVLRPAMSAGAIPLAIHPAMAFTGTSVDLVRLRDAYCAVTAPAPVLPIAQALVVEMGSEPFVVTSRTVGLRGCGAGAVSFSTAIVDQSAGTLSGIGVEHRGGSSGRSSAPRWTTPSPRPTARQRCSRPSVRPSTGRPGRATAGSGAG